jgi:iron complex outermembrane receptor protein
MHSDRKPQQGVTEALLAAFFVLAFSTTAIAAGATIDYAALEELFGEPISASATGSPKRESDVPATMIIITAEDIRRSGARDIPGVLRHVPGVDVLWTSNDHSDVSVRGYNQAFAPRLLVLVDGRQVYADYYGFTPWSTVPVELSAIRQIEVVKGPNSALFGFNAVGGVINIITYDAINDDVNAVSVSGGTQGLTQGSAVSTFRIGESAGIRLSAGHRSGDDFDTALTPAELGVRRGNERNSINLDAGVDVGDKLRIGLDASYSDARQAEFSPLYSMSYGDYETNSIKGHIAADTRLGLLQATVYSNRIKSDIYMGDDTNAFMSFDNRVTVAKLESISLLSSRHTVRLSAEYRDNSMVTTPIGGGRVYYDVAAIGGMWEWQIDTAVTLTSAVRLDRWSLGRSGSVPPGYLLTNDEWDRSETEPSFNAGIVWLASDTDTWRLLAGRGVQLPNLLSLGGLVLPIPPFGFAGGVPDLEPTVVDNLELSWIRTLSGIPAQLHIGAFYGRTHDIAAIGGGSRPADGLLGTPANVGDSTTSGIEVILNGTLRDTWRWGLSYRNQAVNDEFDPGFSVAATYTDFENTTPRHTSTANVGWQLGPWQADVYGRYQSDISGIVVDPIQFIGSLVTVPAYFALDGRVSYTINDRWMFALSGQNLTRPEQRQSSAPAVERTVFATLSLDFGSRE